jgi:hypothetical protein
MGHSDPNHNSHDGHGAHEGMGHGDQPGVHGMFMCGQESVFFSHLPMFGHRHHDFQVLVEVSLTDDQSPVDPVTRQRKDPMTEYLRDREETGQTLYTFRPEPFRLPDLVMPAGSPVGRAMVGKIFNGHFEKGGAPLITTRARVETVFHFRQFDRNAQPLRNLEYVLFGKGSELFLAHLITRPPDFDQVVSLVGTDPKLTEDQVQKGLVVTFDGRPNTLDRRLRPGEKVTGSIVAGEGSESRPITCQVGSELYFEEGELAAEAQDAIFEQTEAEAEAGFE